MTVVDIENNEIKLSPMMLQWQACKQSAKDAVLFFRMGDFYEAFYEDAVLTSRELDLTLTKRQGIPMSGIPHHTSEIYIDKLVAKGFRVAIAEQTEDPKKAKGLVKREVVRIVTPGTIINSSLLSDKANNYVACVSQVGSFYGLAFLDLTTAEFFVIEFEQQNDLLNELYRLRPSEYLVSNKVLEKNKKLFEELKFSYDFLITKWDDWRFEYQLTHDFLTNHFKVLSLDGFGLKGMVAAINSSGALLNYLQDHLCQSIDHLQEISTYSTSQFLNLDRITQKNLELTESFNEKSRKHTLLDIIDHTQTPMGARLIKHWIKQPLLNVESITERQNCIKVLLKNESSFNLLYSLLNEVRDIERLIMKISTGYANPKDIVSLKNSLQVLPKVKKIVNDLPAEANLFSQLEAKIHPLPELVDTISKAIVDEPPMKISDGKIFREGFHKELDELRLICQDSQAWISQYQSHLRENTGIKTLKVGYTRMFGYYIEVSKGQAEKMPDTFQRRQTLVNGERFITPELKDFETKVLTAEEKISEIETELFTLLRQEIAKFSDTIITNAQAIAQIDCLQSLAKVAKTYHYSKPIVDYSNTLEIIEGRHPVIESSNLSERFTPNDTYLDDDSNRLLLITGPNMAGKSTYIRQVALIVILAQMGSYVPAKKAHIGIIDKVFTRIGASDDLARGQSTFMVEMAETANILNNATSRSLVILDEIGRGTSTYDGISIAWSVAEYLLLTEGKLAKTLFATHYWELTQLEEKIPGAVNYHVAVLESQDSIVFLRKIIKGCTDKSYGIHVGRLAGLPSAVIQRAKEILEYLEQTPQKKANMDIVKPKKQKSKVKNINNELQLTFFS